jgi:class 3 adenylate cyclase
MKKPVIVCIDDEPMILSSLKRQLKAALGDEFEIETAVGGIDALELMEALLEEGSEVALVISDYIMPDMKGDEVLKLIHQVSPQTLKIMLTGQASLEGVTNAINSARLYRYIAKPWQNEDLNLTVKEALKSYLNDKKLEEQNIALLEINQELAELNRSLSRFVPDQFLQLLDKKSITDIKLGDAVQKEMSVLFSDIRSFTSLSETMTPEDNFKFINGYLSRMEPAIIENRGFIDKYVGDGLMALFSNDADDAVKAGVTMLKILTEYNKTRTRPERPPIKIGIGINTGNLMLGTVGGQYRIDGTVISDAVNLASRLEALTKAYGVSLLISHYTLSQMQEPMNYALRLIDRVRVKGKSKKIAVFEVFEADPPSVRATKLATKPIFEKALFRYYQGNIEQAVQLLSDCLQIDPSDRVAEIYLERCCKPQTEILHNPVPTAFL